MLHFNYANVVILSYFIIIGTVSAEIHVNVATGSDSGTGTALLPLASLSAGIAAATGTETITVAAGIYSGPSNSNVQADGRTLVCSTAGACIVRPDNDVPALRLLANVDTSTVTGFSFEDGSTTLVSVTGNAANFNSCKFDNTTGGGAVVVNSGASFACSSCSWDSNGRRDPQPASGSALDVAGGTVVLTSSEIKDCSSLSRGGAVIVRNGGSLAVTDGVFTGNNVENRAALEGDGGAIYVDDQSSSLSLSGTACIFRGNDAFQDGGGVYCKGCDGVTIRDCTFDENTAVNNGGGLFVESGSGSFDKILFQKNEAMIGGGVEVDSGSSIFNDCTFRENFAEGDGGGMHIEAAAIEVNDCLFEDHLTEDDGACIDIEEGLSIFRRCLFQNNLAEDSGGVAYSKRSSIRFEDCSFQNNEAESLGGGVYHAKSKGGPSFVRCVFNKNKGSHGGAITVGDGVASIDSCTITDNTAASSGGGIFSNKASMWVGNGTSITGGSAIFGGGMLLGSGSAILDGVTIADNFADSSGGGIHAKGDLILVDTTIKNNVAHSGGGIYLTEGTGNFARITIDSNIASDRGGGIYQRAGLIEMSQITILKNQAELACGINMDAGTMNMTYSNITSHSATSSGAGILVRGIAAIRMTHVIISDNTAKVYGGGVACMARSTAVFVSSTVQDNSATVSGGGIWAEVNSNINILYSSVNSNSAKFGGALAATGNISISVSGGRISSNNAASGGGIYIMNENDDSYMLSLADVTLAMNGAIKYGGAVFLEATGPSKVDVTGCTFDKNTAGSAGGAFYSRQIGLSDGNAFANSVFTGNSALRGGGIFGLTASMLPPISHDVTFSDNVASQYGADKGSLSAKLEWAETPGNETTMTGSTMPTFRVRLVDEYSQQVLGVDEESLESFTLVEVVTGDGSSDVFGESLKLAVQSRIEITARIAAGAGSHPIIIRVVDTGFSTEEMSLTTFVEVETECPLGEDLHLVLPSHTHESCTRAVCTQPCLNGGTCVRDDKCLCANDYIGDTCNQLKSKTPVGGIVGGIVGGLLAIGLVGGMLVKRHQQHAKLLQQLLRVNSLDISFESSHASQASRISAISNITFESSGSDRRKNRKQQFARTCTLHDTAVALRTISYIPELNNQVVTELSVAYNCVHVNINRFIGLVEGTGKIENSLLWAYASRGSLADVLANEHYQLDSIFRFSLSRDLAKALCFLHSQVHIQAHGRLTSSNCVIDNRWVLRVTDFGLPSFTEPMNIPKMKDMSDDRKSSCLFWSSPEILNGGKHETAAADTWAFGIIMIEMVTRELPYFEALEGGTSPTEIVNAVKGGKPPKQTMKDAPSGWEQVVYKCLTTSVESRIGIERVRDSITKLDPNRKIDVMDTMMNMLEKYSKHLESLVEARTKELHEEKKKSETLLYQMLPKSVVNDLKAGKNVQAEIFSECSIFFSDIVGFTSISAASTPLQVVDLLNDLYTCFDTIIDDHDVYKVETIGDAYMVTSGIPIRNGNRHAGEICTLALNLLASTTGFVIRHQPTAQLQLRIGIHSGPCVSGVVGIKMPRYCLFGDTVNTASRMESGGRALRIHISSNTNAVLELIGGYKTESRGAIEVKGKGHMETFWVLGKEGFNKKLPSLERAAPESMHDIK